jgi:pimeloyl-ACP methyl ester carboxylesterase
MDVPPIRYARTSDGVNIAYYVVGEGPTVVRTLGWFTHIEQEWTWGHLPWPRLAEHVRLVLYDGRGFGLSDRDALAFTPDTEMLDVEAVVESAGLVNSRSSARQPAPMPPSDTSQSIPNRSRIC